MAAQSCPSCPAFRALLYAWCSSGSWSNNRFKGKLQQHGGGGGKRSASHLGDGGAAAPVKRNRKRGCRELRERKRTLCFCFLHHERKESSQGSGIVNVRMGRGGGGQSSFQAYLLNKIRLDPVPSSEGGDEIIPKSHRSPAKAHQSSPLRPPPRRGKRERWRMGNPRSWSPHFFPFSSFPLFLSPVNLTRTISSSFPRPECSLSEAIVARPRRGREGYMFYRRNSSWKEWKIGKIRARGKTKIPRRKEKYYIRDARERERERRRGSRRKD